MRALLGEGDESEKEVCEHAVRGQGRRAHSEQLEHEAGQLGMVHHVGRGGRPSRAHLPTVTATLNY